MAFAYNSIRFIFLFHLFSNSIGALRPRGVSLQRKVFYNPTKDFRCLDGSTIVPFLHVNDDYCDCLDGSDEPGTPACQNGAFNCLNHGHIPLTLPSNRVNDGICDCCDASDEYSSTADCFNNCKELGERALIHAKAVQDTYLKGEEIRNEYIKLSKEKKEKYEELLKDLMKQEQAAMAVKNDKQDEKENAEGKESLILSREKELRKAKEKRIAMEKQMLIEQEQKEEVEGQRAFTELDINGDGKISVNEIKSFIVFDYDGDGNVSDNEALFFMQMRQEMNLDEFLRLGWQIMKPAFLKETVSGNGNEFTTVQDDDNVQKERDGISIGSTINVRDKENILKDAAVARQDYADADQLYRDIQAEIWHLKNKLKSDFGESDEFLVLETQCFEFSDKRYLYKFCPFDRIIQVVKVNEEETLIGLWDKWNGPGIEYYSEMHFTRGASCWNGPNRSAKVHVQCGVENKVVSMTEQSPCTYWFEFTTPAACGDLPEDIVGILKNDLVIL